MNKCWGIIQKNKGLWEIKRLYSCSRYSWNGIFSSKNQNVKYLLCVIDIFTKHTWVLALKDKKSITVLIAFIERVNESNCKPNKLWVDQGRELYNKPMHE